MNESVFVQLISNIYYIYYSFLCISFLLPMSETKCTEISFLLCSVFANHFFEESRLNFLNS